MGIYGAKRKGSSAYVLPRHIISSADVSRIINSDQVQSVIRPAVTSQLVHLKNRSVMVALNPYFAQTRQREAARVKANRKKSAKAKRSEASHAAGKKYWEMMMGESSDEEESGSSSGDESSDDE